VRAVCAGRAVCTAHAAATTASPGAVVAEHAASDQVDPAARFASAPQMRWPHSCSGLEALAAPLGYSSLQWCGVLWW